MKMKKIIYLSLLLPVLLSCNKDQWEKELDDFEITVEKSEYSVGEVVTFNIQGNPDLITFYSGEKGNSYEFVDKDRIAETQMFFSFRTTIAKNSTNSLNPSVVLISYSKDFSGEYTEEAIEKATWTDITEKFTLPDKVEVEKLPSGSVEMSSVYGDNNEIYLKYDYNVKAYDASARNGRAVWTFTDVNVLGDIDGVEERLYDISEMGWKIVIGEGYDESGQDKGNLPKVDVNKITMQSAFKPSNDKTAWAVSGPIRKLDVVNYGPDKGVGIKALADPIKTSYEYKYSAPGEYQVTFVAKKIDSDRQKEVVRQLKLIITE